MFQQNHESNPETETKNGYEKDKTGGGGEREGQERKVPRELSLEQREVV
jgi:hypothetical protein